MTSSLQQSRGESLEIHRYPPECIIIAENTAVSWTVLGLIDMYSLPINNHLYSFTGSCFHLQGIEGVLNSSIWFKFTIIGKISVHCGDKNKPVGYGQGKLKVESRLFKARGRALKGCPDISSAIWWRVTKFQSD